MALFRGLGSAIFVCSSLFVNSAACDQVSFSGELGGWARYYPDEPQWVGQEQGNDLELTFAPGVSWVGEDGLSMVVAEMFFRGNSSDKNRNHVDLSELLYTRKYSGFDISLGVGKVFWGTTESRHLVDVVNQTDAVEELKHEQKLGQPMLNVNVYRDWGALGFFYLPYFRERTFPAIDGRQRYEKPVDTDNPVYRGGGGRETQDFSIRYSHYVGDFDFALYFFDGINRAPAYVESGDYLSPIYYQMSQVGFDGQYVYDALLVKYEQIIQENEVERYAASVAGLEYTFYSVWDKVWDVGLIAEYLYSGKEFGGRDLFDDDVFVGVRAAMNDVADTTLLAGAYLDSNDGDVIFLAEFESRVSSRTTLGVKVELFSGRGSVADLDHDDLIEVSYKIFF